MANLIPNVYFNLRDRNGGGGMGPTPIPPTPGRDWYYALIMRFW